MSQQNRNASFRSSTSLYPIPCSRAASHLRGLSIISTVPGDRIDPFMGLSDSFQTLTELRAMLDRAGRRPNHRLGQNFLIDRNLMMKLVSAAELGPRDTCLEVGPGAVNLTALLASRA